MKKALKSFFVLVLCFVMVASIAPIGTVVAAEGGATVACPATIHPNEKIEVSFSGAPTDTDAYIVMAPATVQDNAEAVNQRLELIYLEKKANGTVSFTAPWNTGEYKFLMFINRDTVFLAKSQNITVEQYKAQINATPKSVEPGGKISIQYSGIPTLCGQVYVVTMKESSKSTPEAVSNERVDMVFLDSTKSNGVVQVKAPTTSGKYDYRVVINRDTIIIGTSNPVQVSEIKPTLIASPKTAKKKAKITVTYKNAPIHMGSVYIVMMKKSSLSTAKAVSNERLQLIYVKSKDGKVQFTAPDKPGTYNFRIFLNKGTVFKGISNSIVIK